MGWDKGRYYTRSKRVDGKVVREYFGCGPEAQRAAQEDIEARDRRRNQQLEEQIERDTCDALDAPFEELDIFFAVVVEVALINAGYKRHNRGGLCNRMLWDHTVSSISGHLERRLNQLIVMLLSALDGNWVVSVGAKSILLQSVAGIYDQYGHLKVQVATA